MKLEEIEEYLYHTDVDENSFIHCVDYSFRKPNEYFLTEIGANKFVDKLCKKFPFYKKTVKIKKYTIKDLIEKNKQRRIK